MAITEEQISDEELEEEPLEEEINFNRDKAFVYVEFASVDSVTFGMELNRISPNHLMLLSRYFEFYANMGLSQQLRQQQMEEQIRQQQIVRPDQGVSPDEAQKLWTPKGTLEH